jgi:hypothetical protein
VDCGLEIERKLLQCNVFAHRHPRVSLPDAYRHQGMVIQTFVGRLVVEDSQRPAPAGELAGDRRVSDHRAFLAWIEADPAGVQALIGGLPACQGGRGGGRPSVGRRSCPGGYRAR